MTVHISTSEVRFVTTELTPTGRAVSASSRAIPRRDCIWLSPPRRGRRNSAKTAKNSTAPSEDSDTPSMPAAAESARMSVTEGKRAIITLPWEFTKPHSHSPAPTLTAPSAACESAVGYILLMPS